MAKKVRKSKITQAQVKKLLKDYKISECQVNILRLTISNDELQKSLFRKYCIRDCVVRLERLADSNIPKASTDAKKNLLSAPKKETVRLNVSWIPTVAMTQKNSAQALSALSDYQSQNGILRRVIGKRTSNSKSTKKPKKRQRAKPMFVKPTGETNSIEKNTADTHPKFSTKYGSPNRALKSITSQHPLESPPKPVSPCQKLLDNFKAKVETNNFNQD